jgi:hypothetical protein
MTDKNLIKEIISTYEKHGWKPGRVFVSAGTMESIGFDALNELFPEGDLQIADFDAIWFERPSKKGNTAIELRHIGTAPFALFELVGEDSPADDIRSELENRMAAYASKSAKKDH